MEFSEILILAAAMLATGFVGGIVAGLLGVGGGIVIVPVLEFALEFIGVPSAIRMHIAVATSLAVIVPTSISSARAHYKRGSVDTSIIKLWLPYVFVGALIGTYIASGASERILSGVFGVTALIVAIKMLLPLDDLTLSTDVPRHVGTRIIPTAIGGISTMMGIGGGTLGVPTLALMNQSIHRAVGTSALFGLVVSLPGTVGFMLLGNESPDLPFGSIGFVNLVGFAIIAPTTVLAAPLGAALAHRLTQRQLGSLFGAFLFLVATRMLLKTIG